MNPRDLGMKEVTERVRSFQMNKKNLHRSLLLTQGHHGQMRSPRTTQCGEYPKKRRRTQYCKDVLIISMRVPSSKPPGDAAAHFMK